MNCKYLKMRTSEVGSISYVCHLKENIRTRPEHLDKMRLITSEFKKLTGDETGGSPNCFYKTRNSLEMSDCPCYESQQKI